MSEFYPQIQRTDASDHICVSQWPVLNVKASFCMCLEFADKILILAVLERWLLQLRETDYGRPKNRACHYIFALRFLLSFFFFLLFSSPNLSGRRLDVYHASTHGVALVRI